MPGRVEDGVVDCWSGDLLLARVMAEVVVGEGVSIGENNSARHATVLG